MAITARSSSSNSPSKYKYDVFLSFRGSDTRKSFICHLYAALKRKGISTFIDSEELEKGDRISMLFEAIKSSRISIIVFSVNYASSVWCLREVAVIMECLKSKKIRRVVPVFYNVEPAHVKNQLESFKKSFQKHEKEGWEKQKLAVWRSCLQSAANLSGFNSADSSSKDDFHFVETITIATCKYLKPAWKHDVIISCHKDDAEPKFVSQFCAALEQKGISTIIPADVPDDAGPVKAIDESGLAVIVFSNDYPFSKVCLNQLVQFIDRMDKMKKPTIVIYYDLASSDVRDMKGSFKKAFADYERKGTCTGDQLKWQHALARASTISDSWETLDENTNSKHGG